MNHQEPKLEGSIHVPAQHSHLRRKVGVVLCVVMIVLAGYVIYLQNQNTAILSASTDLALSAGEHATANYRTYVGKYKETKIELDETTKKLEEVNRQLDQVTAELATTKGLLTQTQGMLAQAQDENVKLKKELQVLDQFRNSQNVQNVDELQDKIKNLKDKDSQISLQLADLKSQLRAFQADITTPEEGRSLIVLYQDKIRLVKGHMRYLKQEAFFAKIAAQKEKDRLAALNGNNGYVVHNGKLQGPNGTTKTFAIDVKNAQ